MYNPHLCIKYPPLLHLCLLTALKTMKIFKPHRSTMRRRLNEICLLKTIILCNAERPNDDIKHIFIQPEEDIFRERE